MNHQQTEEGLMVPVLPIAQLEEIYDRVVRDEILVKGESSSRELSVGGAGCRRGCYWMDSDSQYAVPQTNQEYQLQRMFVEVARLCEVAQLAVPAITAVCNSCVRTI